MLRQQYRHQTHPAATAVKLLNKEISSQSVQNALATLRKNNQIIKDETRGGISPISPPCLVALGSTLPPALTLISGSVEGVLASGIGCCCTRDLG
jgi:hypothetical protein